MSSMEISNLTVDKMRKMFAEGKRFDGRGLLDYRNVEVSLDVSNKAEGSARVKIGKTEVIVGVKLQLGEPYPDSLDKGNLMVSGDLLPLASPRFEMGPPKFEAIELPRVIDRSIRESKFIELDKLVLVPGEKVWTVMIDIYPINDDGNLIDAAGLAALVALKNTKMPALDKDGKIDYYAKSTKSLPLLEGTAPISISFFKLGDSIILDPTREEEEACEVRLVMGLSKYKGQMMINSCQKSGKESVPVTQEDIEKMAELAPGKFEALSKNLKKFI